MMKGKVLVIGSLRSARFCECSDGLDRQRFKFLSDYCLNGIWEATICGSL